MGAAMPSLEDDRDAEYAAGRVPGRFYVSRRFPQGGPDSGIVDPRICRFAYQVADENAEVLCESEDGWEVVLRETASRQQLKALFFEDTRSVQYLTFQRFNAAGKHLERESFVLTGAEVDALASYLALIRSPSLALAESDEGIRLLPEGVDALLADDASRREVFRRYRGAIEDFVEADADSSEVVAFARRRQQLRVFEALLQDDDAVARRRSVLKQLGRRSGVEDVWQDFFESNQWIFGTGLAPQFLHAWSAEKLEQTVAGSSLFGQGKRPDALMRTAGALSSLVFVEIKTSETPLLHPTAYRAGTWRVGEEVAGGVAQCQSTIDEVMRHALRELDAVDEHGFRTGESAFVCRPRSVLVVGSLRQMMKGDEPNVAMFESFERFRRSLRDPEIITFDELYARAAMTLTLSDGDEERAEQATDDRS
jgi:hypothetical protein